MLFPHVLLSNARQDGRGHQADVVVSLLNLFLVVEVGIANLHGAVVADAVTGVADAEAPGRTQVAKFAPID